jgi:hypothetical protein
MPLLGMHTDIALDIESLRPTGSCSLYRGHPVIVCKQWTAARGLAGIGRPIARGTRLPASWHTLSTTTTMTETSTRAEPGWRLPAGHLTSQSEPPCKVKVQQRQHPNGNEGPTVHTIHLVLVALGTAAHQSDVASDQRNLVQRYN